MSLLIFALIVLCLAGLGCWAVRVIQLPAPVGVIAQVVICIVAIIIIAQKAGVF